MSLVLQALDRTVVVNKELSHSFRLRSDPRLVSSGRRQNRTSDQWEKTDGCSFVQSFFNSFVGF